MLRRECGNVPEKPSLWWLPIKGIPKRFIPFLIPCPSHRQVLPGFAADGLGEPWAIPRFAPGAAISGFAQGNQCLGRCQGRGTYSPPENGGWVSEKGGTHPPPENGRGCSFRCPLPQNCNCPQRRLAKTCCPNSTSYTVWGRNYSGCQWVFREQKVRGIWFNRNPGSGLWLFDLVTTSMRTAPKG